MQFVKAGHYAEAIRFLEDVLAQYRVGMPSLNPLVMSLPSALLTAGLPNWILRRSPSLVCDSSKHWEVQLGVATVSTRHVTSWKACDLRC